MAICNRDNDGSEQRKEFELSLNTTVVTAATLFVGVMPYPGNIREAAIAGGGLSGAPVYNINVHRWTSAGLTVFDPLGTAATIAGAFGLSGGVVEWSVTSSPVALQAGDLLVVKSSGSNTAATWVLANIVVQKTQDIVSYSF